MLYEIPAIFTVIKSDRADLIISHEGYVLFLALKR